MATASVQLRFYVKGWNTNDDGTKIYAVIEDETGKQFIIEGDQLTAAFEKQAELTGKTFKELVDIANEKYVSR